MYWLILFYYLLLIVIAAAGLVISVFGLPGLWLMVAAAVGYTLAAGDAVLGWQVVAVLAVLALASEIFEFLAGAAGSSSAGGSWRGIVGAAVGGIAGGIVGVPIPVVGPILGAILGAAIGAGVLELTSGKTSMEQAGHIAVGAAKGRFWGALSKLVFGTIMLVVLVIYAFPVPSDLEAVPAIESAPANPDQAWSGLFENQV
ncbi:DUF456 domain-containing protein [Aeoliella sp. SH292]|uniref:DUF456 domain-containing protein n=1 Tax=Aeoliella sp. SH292 TaxID=3454464 RepID=UPI003F95A4AB